MLKYTLAASAAVAAVLALSVPSYAAADSATVTINGTVGAVCSLGSLTGQTVSVGDISDGNGGLGSNATTGLASLDLGTWFCNGANSTVSLSATPFQNSVTTSDTTNFTSQVNYQATISFGGGSYTLDTANGINYHNVPVGIFSQDVKPTQIHADSIGSKKLVAGDYQTVISVTLTPAA
ncbi:MAG: hypothetical protein WBQ17_03365 [Rhizomicrobium sp.]